MTRYKNENCLEGISCPKCKEEESFHISMRADIQITDEGTDSHEDTEWGPESHISCDACGHEGIVAQFRRSLDKAERKRALLFSKMDKAITAAMHNNPARNLYLAEVIAAAAAMIQESH